MNVCHRWFISMGKPQKKDTNAIELWWSSATCFIVRWSIWSMVSAPSSGQAPEFDAGFTLAATTRILMPSRHFQTLRSLPSFWRKAESKDWTSWANVPIFGTFFGAWYEGPRFFLSPIGRWSTHIPWGSLETSCKSWMRTYLLSASRCRPVVASTTAKSRIIG